METYKQMFKRLQEDLNDKSNAHLKLDAEVFNNGFGCSLIMGKYLKAREEWRTSWNNYFGFLSHLKGKDIIQTIFQTDKE